MVDSRKQTQRVPKDWLPGLERRARAGRERSEGDAPTCGGQRPTRGGGERPLRRVVANLGPRFADYVVVDGEFATAPFLHTTEELRLKVVARLKDNLPELRAAAQKRFDSQPPPTAHSMLSGGPGPGATLGRRRLRPLGKLALDEGPRAALPPDQAQPRGH